MFFNSIDFAVFLPIIFVLYWALDKSKLQYQNTVLLIASYLFYGWWDWRFLFLILFSTIVDYTIALRMEQTENQQHRKRWLWLSLGVNLGLLGVFKYYNFFVDNFIAAFSFFGSPISIQSLHIILPVGISFYTFQTLSYTIDVYRKDLKPTNNFIDFAAFVSFFPQLVAGPIERATNLLPQFYTKHKFNESQATEGLRQILWGLFKKMVIADNCAVLANFTFDNPEMYGGSTLLLGAIFFSFQIYGDFSGYSDIAIGVAKLFGFKLMQNFAFPYFSRDIAEFWRRWHISLSTWFRDYLYIPLGGSRGGTASKVRNTFIIFLVSGFWHGANWTYVVWGGLNAIYFLPLLLLKRNRKYTNDIAANRYLPSLREGFGILTTFILTTLAWVFFRAKSLEAAFDYLGGIFSTSLLSIPTLSGRNTDMVVLMLLLVFFLVVEWIGRHKQFAISKLNLNPIGRYFLYLFIATLIFVFQGEQQDFIYFQF